MLLVLMYPVKSSPMPPLEVTLNRCSELSSGQKNALATAPRNFSTPALIFTGGPAPKGEKNEMDLLI
jgi:hypothetical protein